MKYSNGTDTLKKKVIVGFICAKTYFREGGRHSGMEYILLTNKSEKIQSQCSTGQLYIGAPIATALKSASW